MNQLRALRSRIVGLVCLSCLCVASVARANEIWVAPTLQTDTGGLGVGNGIWPVSPIGVTRLAVAIPDDLQTFQGAKIVLIPKAPAGAGVLHLHVCTAENSDMVGASCVGPIDHPFTGVVNRLVEVDVSTALAPSVAGPGTQYIAVAAYTTPTFTTDHIAGMRFAYVPVAPVGVATLGANTFTGTQTAPAFVGDGSGLTNVSSNLLDGLDSTAFAAAVHGHNVTQVTNAARLAGGNSFTGTQTIDAGNLDFDPSTATAGNITKDGALFLHNRGDESTFLGINAGQLVTGGLQNTAVGFRALASATGSASANTAVGSYALAANTSGDGNAAFGIGALERHTSGLINTAVGTNALGFNTTGGSNTATGQAALWNNTTGMSNTAVGRYAGRDSTTGSNNVYVGAEVHGVAGESNTMYLGKVGTQLKTLIAGVRGITTGVADAIPVIIDSNGQLGTISSSRRFKEDIHDMPTSLSDRLLRLRPVTFRYTQAYTDGSKPIQYGLVAEEVAEVFPELAVRNAQGEVETVHYET